MIGQLCSLTYFGTKSVSPEVNYCMTALGCTYNKALNPTSLPVIALEEIIRPYCSSCYTISTVIQNYEPTGMKISFTILCALEKG